MPLPTRPILTLDVAKKMAEASKKYAAKKGYPALIVAIVDTGGYLLYLERMDGIPPGTVDVATLKARSAVMFGVDSKNFEDAVSDGLIGLVGLPGMAAFQGAVPIAVAGEVIGAIAVSGITKELDREFAQAGADALTDILAK
jgi:glc operon protein GlcG